MTAIRVESALDNSPIRNAWYYRPRILSLHNTALPPNLRCSKDGYPLLRPQSEEYCRTGIRIGDVGVLRPDGFFNYLFNVSFPKDHSLNVGGVPEYFEPVQLAQATHDSEVGPFHTGYMWKNLMQPELQTSEMQCVLQLCVSELLFNDLQYRILGKL